MVLKVLLAVDVHLFRGALASLLNLENDIDVVAEVSSSSEIMPAAVRRVPDVAVIDADLPGAGGPSAVEQLRKQVPSCRTLLLVSVHQPSVLNAAKTASGYLAKDAKPSQLAAAVRRIGAGERTGPTPPAMPAQPLSRRELEVLRLAAHGEEPSEIAQSLHLSLGTVRNYLTSVVTKLGARNRVDAIRRAEEAGWLP